MLAFACVLLFGVGVAQGNDLRLERQGETLYLRDGKERIEVNPNAQSRSVTLSDRTVVRIGPRGEVTVTDRKGVGKRLRLEKADWFAPGAAFVRERRLEPATTDDPGLGDLVAAGDRALAVMSWSSAALSGRPLLYQEVVAIYPSGKVEALRPLSPPKVTFGGQSRLWGLGTDLVLHEGDALLKIAPNARTIRPLAKLDPGFVGQGAAEGRWVVFERSDGYGRMGEPAASLWRYDHARRKTSKVVQAPSNGSVLRVAKTGPWVLVMNSDAEGRPSLLALSLTDSRKTILKGYLTSAWVWRGRIVVPTGEGVDLYSVSTGRLSRSLRADDGGR